MKKLLILMAVAMLTANTVGCSCGRRMGDWFNQGSYCAQPACAQPACAPCAQSSPYMVAPRQMVIAPTAAPCQSCCPTTSCMPTCEPSCGQPYMGMPSYSGYWSEGCDSCNTSYGDMPYDDMSYDSSPDQVYPGPASE